MMTSSITAATESGPMSPLTTTTNTEVIDLPTTDSSLAADCDPAPGVTETITSTDESDSMSLDGWIDSSDPEDSLSLEERIYDELPYDIHEAREWIEGNCSFRERLIALMFLVGQMDIREWLTLLGYFWCGLESGCVPFYEVVEVIKEWTDDPLTVIPELMDQKEKAAFDSLPEQITIFRGCGPENKGGFSWTLNRNIAIRFPFSRGYWAEQPLLLTATINKNRAAALKLERNEQEVLVVDLHESCWTEEFITEQSPTKNTATCVSDLS